MDDENVTDNDRLFLACMNGQVDIVSELLKYPTIDVNEGVSIEYIDDIK